MPFLKVWVILPMALFFTFIFTRLSNKFSKEKVFYIMLSLFLCFFFIFTIFLYPFRDVLHPNNFADKLQTILPSGFKGLIAIFRNWTFTLFYIFSEMWSTMIMTVLFWGFANEVSSVKDAKRYYAILSIGANLATTLSGQVATWVSNHSFNSKIPFGIDSWSQSLIFLNTIVIFSGILTMGLFKWLHLKGFGYPCCIKKNPKQSEKIKMGIRNNFKYLAKSKYLICIAVIVLMFNMSMTLIEVVWKDQVKQLYPNPSDFNAYMGRVLSGIGIIATLLAFISGKIIRKFKWTFAALITPIIILTTGFAFFSAIFFKNSYSLSFAAILSCSPLALGVFFGSLQNCLARASKYAIFDSTKELAFIPLSNECKLKGKAAIDGIGSRIGKSSASIIHQTLIVSFGSIALSTPIIAFILFFVITIWIFSAKLLGKKFQLLTKQEETIKYSDVEEKLKEEKTKDLEETLATIK